MAASGSDVSRIESDISQTITLADTLVTLIREPISLLYNSIAKTASLKRSLGVWQEQALDGNGQCRLPALRLKELERYLVTLDARIPEAPRENSPRACEDHGRLKLSWIPWQKQSRKPVSKPEMPSDGTACWAYFLFALGIRPKENVVVWAPSVDGFISTQNGGIEMEIDGSALCHIINLYSVMRNHRCYGERGLTDRRKEQECEFQFGNLAWKMVNNQLHAHFKPGVEIELAAAKHPFGEEGYLMSPNTIMPLYLTSVYHGTSDSRYRLAPANAPLLERIERLVTCYRRLEGRRWEKDLLLISYEWFEEAARVKRRVLAQGGKDHSFFDDVCRHLRPLFCGDSLWAEATAKEHFLLDRDMFKFFVPRTAVGSDPYYPTTSADRAIEETLASYENQPEGSWKRSLFDMRQYVLAIAQIPNKVVLEPKWNVQLIEFTTSCDLWHRKVLLGAPISTRCQSE